MQYRTHHEIQLSEIGLGCYGLSGVYGQKDHQQFKQVITRAYDLGVTFFDTADAYGPAETVLGEVIQPFRDNILLATKVGVSGGIKPNLSPTYIKTACEQSLQNLQTDRIDLYQVHFDDPDTPVDDTIAALEDLVQAGKIRRYGIGHLPVEKVVNYFDKGNIFSMLMEFSAAAREARQQVLPLCQQHNVGAIAFSITGRGLLTGSLSETCVFEPGDIRNVDPLFQRERHTFATRIASRFRQIGIPLGMTPVQVAIAWVLAQPGIICALCGPSNIDHLEENLAASGRVLPENVLTQLDSFFVAEDELLIEAERISVRAILLEPLPMEPLHAFKDLVYAIETGLLLGFASEKEVLPIFHDLFSERNRLGLRSRAFLVEIQDCLIALFDL